MAQYPFLVQIAWHVVEQLVSEWSKNPYLWEKEADIQSELRTRLQTIYSLLGCGEIISTAPDSNDPDKKHIYRYSRVACEPSINYKYSDGKIYRAMPDVVVFDDLPKPSEEPAHWPILWACEMKYMNSDTSEWDVEKLGYLIDQEKISFGCWLTFRLSDSFSITWEKRKHAMKLWVCIANAQALPPIQPKT